MLIRILGAVHGILLLALGQAATTPPSRQPPKTPADNPYQVATFCIPGVQASRPPIAVGNGEELQNALDRASGGDTIALAAGSIFRPPTGDGSFVLRNRPVAAGQWITIRSANNAFDAGAALPPGVRVDASDAYRMPAIRASTSGKPAFRTEPGAHGYRLIGLDVGIDAAVSTVFSLIELGTGSESSVDDEPQDIIIDRCYIHGNDTGNFRRGVAANGRRIAVIDSYVENFHDANSDSQAIIGWNGAGPFKIVNNFLEAAGENIMFGGGDPSIANLVPSDIEFRRNFSTKRLAWRTSRVPVKNAFELKNARRVLVEGNTFEHVWTSGQDGTAILLKSANQDGRCPWCVTEYVTFRNNIVRGAAHGLIINAAETGSRGSPLPVRANNVRIENVLFEDIGGHDWGGGKLLRVFGGVANLEITHITSVGNPTGILDPLDPADVNPNLTFKNNIVERMFYGIGAGRDEGITTVTRNFGPFVYNQNLLVNTSGPTEQAISDSALKSRYPPVTLVASGWKAVGFEAGRYKLMPSSPYYHAGDDGKDLGADVDAIAAAQAGPSSVSCSQVIARPRAQQ